MMTPTEYDLFLIVTVSQNHEINDRIHTFQTSYSVTFQSLPKVLRFEFFLGRSEFLCLLLQFREKFAPIQRRRVNDLGRNNVDPAPPLFYKSLDLIPNLVDEIWRITHGGKLSFRHSKEHKRVTNCFRLFQPVKNLLQHFRSTS